MLWFGNSGEFVAAIAWGPVSGIVELLVEAAVDGKTWNDGASDHFLQNVFNLISASDLKACRE